MLRVGLSGGIGSGKSTVSRRLVEHGAVLIDADLLAREVVEPGTEGLALVRKRFGDDVLTPDGGLDRPALGQIVFGDDKARADLNAILHPRILEETQRRMDAAPEDAVVVHDLPLLVELDRSANYHLTVVVGAGEGVRLRRLLEDRGMSEADARARIAAQASDEQRRAVADVWLDNEGGVDELHAQVDDLWRDRLVPFEENLRTRTAVRRPPRVELVAPDPAWPTVAARLLDRIRGQLDRVGLSGEAAGYDHIGSTAVPGLVAKDVIDLQVTVVDLGLAGTASFENAMLAAGFVTSGPRQDPVHEWAPEVTGWQKYVFLNADPARVVHLHVRRTGSPGEQAAVHFRDWLSANPDERDAYAAAKRAAAAAHPGDSEGTRGAYTRAKEPWFVENLPRARSWAVGETG